jgi:hypothetical protein
VREDLESYRSALEWLVERRRSSEASDIAWELKYFWLIRDTRLKDSTGMNRFRPCPLFPRRPS